jgi:two-component system, response regulator
MNTRLDILLIDDDGADAAFFDIAVDKTRLNIKLRTLTSGQQAIDYLEGKGEFADRVLHPLPDAIVLDLRMPKVNGFDFLTWRKSSPLISRIPAVVFTGVKSFDEVKQVMELGATGHIVKPVDFDEWEKVVKEIWGIASRAADLASTA